MAITSVHYLRQADIFYELTPAQLEQVAALCDERRVNTGEVIFKENSSSDELYVIAQGEVEIVVDPALVSDGKGGGPGPMTIVTLRRGQSFGEVALVDQGLRSATARGAQQNTLLLVIPRNQLMKLCEADKGLGFRLMRNLAADLAMKMRNTDLQIRQQLLEGARRRG